MVRHSRASRRRKQETPSSHTGSTLALLVLSCFFVSGLTGLIYEIVWMRMIVKIMGGAPFAVAIVLTVFMGGLGLGSYLAGRTCDRVEKPGRLVQLYGLLELAIGAYGLVLPFLLQAFRPLYAVIYNGLSDHFLLYNLITFAGCFLLLIIPVTFMGATLPILSRFMVTRLSHVGMHVGRLYGLNTIGAAVGSLLCGFWLLEHFGIWGSLGTAVVLNIGIGVTCLLAGRSEEKPIHAIAENPPPSNQPDISTGSKQRLVGHGSLVVFAVSGFCAMGYEVLWTKLLGLIIGPTTYSFTLVLVTFIIGLAVGAMLFGRIADRSRNPVLLLLYTQVAAALAALIISHLIGNSQIFFSKLIYEYKESFTLLASLKSLALFAIILPATIFLGGAFPLVTRIYMRSLATRGRSVGFAYAVNSVGAVLGSFCAGFVLLPLLGKENGLSLLVGLQLVAALAVGTIIYRSSVGSRWRWVRLVIPVLIGLTALVQYPRWNRQLLSKGQYHQFTHPERLNLGWWESLVSGTAQFSRYETGRELVYFGDGVGGFTTVFKIAEDALGNVKYSLLNSGKVDASTGGRDMRTQTMLAHFPMLFHDNPADVLVLGLASGITGGEILHYPVEKLDVIEINQQVVAASNFFIPWNNDLLADERTRLIIQDGRAHLALTDQTYDVVVSEPSNPWMAGLAALFTLDFFDDVKNRLKDDGIFVQWLHAYQMDWATLAMVGRTFTRAFPNSILMMPRFAGVGGDCFLIGFKGAPRLDPNTAGEKIKYARKSDNITLGDHRMLYSFIIHENLMAFFGDGPINTDNRPRLEFAAPRQQYTTDQSLMQRLRSGR
ncbi:MAG: fused MFS/spermidine synthase, partial [Candidatus Zixiibacteriota bacterium]